LSEPIFHLAKPEDWTSSTDNYSPPGVEEEGFIHCSTADQLSRVARDLYADHNDLILLTIDPDALEAGTLRYEDLYGLDEEFPHIYGQLPASAVSSTGPYLTHLEEGLWLDTRFDRDWMDRILHPDFSEVGMSGRTHTREATLASTSREVDLRVRLPHEGYSLALTSEDVGLVRYISHDSLNGVERHAHRTSIWVNTNEGWRLRFHQGTPLP
jgi:uncharacterized protein (DUF952 family)